MEKDIKELKKDIKNVTDGMGSDQINKLLNDIKLVRQIDNENAKLVDLIRESEKKFINTQQHNNYINKEKLQIPHDGLLQNTIKAYQNRPDLESPEQVSHKEYVKKLIKTIENNIKTREKFIQQNVVDDKKNEQIKDIFNQTSKITDNSFKEVTKYIRNICTKRIFDKANEQLEKKIPSSSNPSASSIKAPKPSNEQNTQNQKNSVEKLKRSKKSQGKEIGN